MSSKTIVQPYLFFGGRCEEAIEFYKSVLGAQVEMTMHFDQSPEPMPPGMLAEGWEKKVMHSSFKIGESTVMASDGCGPADTGFHGFRLSLSVDTVEESERLFNALVEGGKVDMPLTKTFWSKSYGMLTDKFGVEWMVNVPAPM